jgi:hypothetical protein
MIVYVLFVHNKSVSKRKVSIIFKKIKNDKKTQKSKKNTFLVGFLGGFFCGFFLVGFLLPTLAPGGRHHEHQGQPQVRRPHRPPGGLQPGHQEQGGRRCGPPSGEQHFF